MRRRNNILITLITLFMLIGITSAYSYASDSDTDWKSEKIFVSGTVAWDDGDNQDGVRPTNLLVKIAVDKSEPVDPVVGSSYFSISENWKTDLYKYDKNKKLVKYLPPELVYTTVDKLKDAGYTIIQNGNDFIFSRTPETIRISGNMSWNDGNDEAETRPSEVIIDILADGHKIGIEKVTADNGWQWTINDLPKYNKGKQIEYTFNVGEIEGYTSEINGNEIVNTKTSSIEGEIIWDDQNDQDGLRPESITARLMKNGIEVSSKALTADKGWTFDFGTFSIYEKNGEKVNYSVEQTEEIEGYKSDINGLSIKNTHITEKINIVVTEEFIHSICVLGIKIELYADGKLIDKKPKNYENDAFKIVFEGLDKYRDGGKRIEYTINAEDVYGCIKEITGNADEGFRIKYINNLCEYRVLVIWKDDNNTYGKRPDNFNIRLFKEEKELYSYTLKNDDCRFQNGDENRWLFVMDSMEILKDGKELEYGIEIDDIAGYDTEIVNEPGGFVITNTLKTKGANKEDGIVKTGDDFNLSILVVLVCCIVLMALVIHRNKVEKEYKR